MFSAVSQILLKQSANEEHASALREYLNWRVIVAYLDFWQCTSFKYVLPTHR